MKSQDITIRVRYPECDPMGFAHHGIFATWFEMGRGEVMRANGISYKHLEDIGFLLPVVDIHVRYKKSVHYDDMLRLESRLVEMTRAKIIFEYTLYREDQIVAMGRTTNACINQEGILQPIPDIIFQSFDLAFPKHTWKPHTKCTAD